MPLIHRAGLGLALVTAFLAGCSTTTSLDDKATRAPVETRTPVAGGAGTAGAAATPSGTPQSRVTTVDLASGAAAGTAALAMPAQRTVYFDFDSFVIKDDFKPVVEGHAKVLTVNRNRKLMIEGHTDERGGREYNLALGQKRAEAVARTLELLGANAAQLEAVSFGEERPAEPGHDEAAWARNRRAELKDR